MSRTQFRLLSFFLPVILSITTSAQSPDNNQQPAQNRSASALKIDPRLFAEANEVWRLIGSAKNPIWPGWDALLLASRRSTRTAPSSLKLP